MIRSSRARRLTIERIELDCRDMSAASAEAMAHALGPALERALVAAGRHVIRVKPDAAISVTRVCPS